MVVVGACGDDDDDGNGDGGGGGGESSQPVTIRMGFTIPNMDALYAMKSMPELAPNLGKAYDIEWFQFASTGETVQGLATGTLDGAVIGSLSAANAIEKGSDIVITGEYLEEKPGYATSAWLVKKDSDIKSAADMEGKTLGVPTGSVLDWLGQAELAEAGVEDYKTVSVQYPTAADALKEGKVDMAMVVEPWKSLSVNDGWARVVFDTNDVVDPLVGTLQGFSPEFVDENPEAVKAFMEDWSKVFDWTLDPANREEVIKSSSEVTKIPAEDLDSYLLTENDVYRPPGGALDQEALQMNWDFFREAGAMEKDLQVSDYVRPELLPQN
jgi:ABC-type nitrate/sulfonate/bicarbonate transport system substrate-binding protein